MADQSKRSVLQRLLRRKPKTPTPARRPLPPLPAGEYACLASPPMSPPASSGYDHLGQRRASQPAEYHALSPTSAAAASPRAPATSYDHLQRTPPTGYTQLLPGYRGDDDDDEQETDEWQPRSRRAQSAPQPMGLYDEAVRPSRANSMAHLARGPQPAIDAFRPPVYFHGDITREQAEAVLAAHPVGHFLVREKIINHQYALSVVEAPGNVAHYLIRRARRVDGSPSSHFMFKLEHLHNAFCVEHTIEAVRRLAAAHNWPRLTTAVAPVRPDSSES